MMTMKKGQEACIYASVLREFYGKYRVSGAEQHANLRKITLEYRTECFMWLFIFICFWNYTFLGAGKR